MGKSKLRENLLELLDGLDVSQLRDETVIALIADKIHRLERENEALQSVNIAEHRQLLDQIEELQRERAALRQNPMYGAHGTYFFLGRDGQKFKLRLIGGTIRELMEVIIHKKQQTFDFIMQEVTEHDFMVR